MVPSNSWLKVIKVAAIVVTIGLTASGQAPSIKKPAGSKPTVKAKASPKDLFGADSITLRDGKILLGQIYDPSPRSGLVVIVRRAWAESNLAEWAAKWSKMERDANAGAEAQRRDRLAAWSRERAPRVGVDDRIKTWLDRELARPAGPGEPSVLMLARLNRGEFKTIQRRGMAAARALRLGWTLGLKDVETMPLADLKDALEGRGLVASGETPISLDALLPSPLEADTQWSLRRAATEVTHDDGVRFIRFGNTILPEPSPGRPPDPSAAGALLSSTLKDLLGEGQSDPLPARLNEVAARGRVGAMVTRLDLAADMGSVTVESALYVRDSRGVWTRGPSRSGSIRTGDAPLQEVQAVAEDPQVKSAFGLVDSLGFGQVSDEMKRKSLAVGATTKRALGLARSALARDIADLTLPLDDPSARAPISREKP